MAEAQLGGRGIVAVTGVDAGGFLQGLVTADIDRLAPGGVAFGALLTPQGKILFDFIIHHHNGAYLFDLPADATAAFVRRLGFYKLRSKVEIADVSDNYTILVDPAPGATPADPRLSDLGARRIGAESQLNLGDGTADYDKTRVALGIAECWRDFATGEIFPHEANFDRSHGLSLSKGCYIGQEVVSRMHHRGSARKRFVPCRIDGGTPKVGSEVTAQDRKVGVTGTAAGGRVLALLRLDRIAGAIGGETPLVCGKSRLWPEPQSWALDDEPQKKASK